MKKERPPGGYSRILQSCSCRPAIFLLVSGVSEAWDSLPDDVFARIRRQDVVEVSLDRAEVPKLLRAYAPQLDKIFSIEALERLYDVGQNNARRALDLAHEAYEVSRRKLEKGSLWRFNNSGVVKSVGILVGLSFHHELGFEPFLRFHPLRESHDIVSSLKGRQPHGNAGKLATRNA